jgi:hypothetical protein
MTMISRVVGAALALACVLAVPARAADQQPTTVLNKNVARRISVEDLQKRMAAGEKPIILDTRVSVGDVMAKGAVRVPNDQIESWAKGKPRDAFIVAYCT